MGDNDEVIVGKDSGLGLIAEWESVAGGTAEGVGVGVDMLKWQEWSTGGCECDIWGQGLCDCGSESSESESLSESLSDSESLSE